MVYSYANEVEPRGWLSEDGAENTGRPRQLQFAGENT